MKNQLIVLIILINLSINAQVGIGTTNPKANLDINASNVSNPNNTDGVLIPRIDNFSSTNPTAAQNGMLVFVTGNGISDKGFYYWNQPSTSWVSIATNTPKHYIGELFGGGIVFYVYDNGQHGLIASLHDLSTNRVAWSDDITTEIFTDNYNGQDNTALIVSQNSTPNKAATLCDSYVYAGFSDWYLPSRSELELLVFQYHIINEILTNDSDPTTNGFILSETYPNYSRYWSSTELNSVTVWCYNFYYRTLKFYSKRDEYNVRAIRKF